jgi:hypothetical protein
MNRLFFSTLISLLQESFIECSHLRADVIRGAHELRVIEEEQGFLPIELDLYEDDECTVHLRLPLTGLPEFVRESWGIQEEIAARVSFQGLSRTAFRRCFGESAIRKERRNPDFDLFLGLPTLTVKRTLFPERPFSIGKQLEFVSSRHFIVY